MNLVWKKDSARAFTIERDGEEAGRLKIHGATGATAQYGAISYSFRVAGLDPAIVAPLRRRFSHDSSIIELGSGETVANFVVKPFRRSLVFKSGARYEWKVSFFLRSAKWVAARKKLVEFRLRGFHSRGDIVVADDAPDFELLVLFGLFLAMTGKGT